MHCLCVYSQPPSYDITLWLDRLPYEQGLDFTLTGGQTVNAPIYVESVKPGKLILSVIRAVL
jgi:hypothetical protein